MTTGRSLGWIVRSRTGKFDVGVWVGIIIFVIAVVLILLVVGGKFLPIR